MSSGWVFSPPPGSWRGLFIYTLFYLKHFGYFITHGVNGAVFSISSQTDAPTFQPQGVSTNLQRVWYSHLDEIGNGTAVEFFGEDAYC